MIYLTGDTHGDMGRFKSKAVRSLRKGDYLIVCGDFGFVWQGGKEEERALRWIASRPYTTLFLDGAYENTAILERYPEQEMLGGMVRVLGKRLYMLKRGHVFTIEGKTIFAMGGGEKEDSNVRRDLDPVWAREMPTVKELEDAALRLERVGYAVDYVVTHEAATTIKNALNIRQHTINPLNTFLDRVLRTCSYRYWFFGCYHIDRKISTMQRALFKDVVPIEPLPDKKKRKVKARPR